jgi:hypothetical protein
MAVTQNPNSQPIQTFAPVFPDPSLLTTEALRREIGNLKDQIDVRLSAADTAIKLIQSATDTSRRETTDGVERASQQLHDLIIAKLDILAKVTSQRFSSIETQFMERDKRTEQLSLADKTAIAAALQAQKEAAGAQNESNAASVTKQEVAFTKLLDQNQALFQTSMSALTTQLNDLKSRLDKGEGQGAGRHEERSDARNLSTDNRGLVFGVIGAAIGASALILTILNHVAK